MLEKLRAEIQLSAQRCMHCGKRLRLSLVDLGDGDMVDSVFSCGNKDCTANRHKLHSFRRLSEKLTEEALLKVPEEELEKYKRYRAAALRAEIKCPICGKVERYVRSGVGATGRLLHFYSCANDFCPNRDQIKIELTEEDVLKIEAKKEETTCPVCGKEMFCSVRCLKEGALICESHCSGCKFHEERSGHCHLRKMDEAENEARAAVDGRKWFNMKVLNR